MKISKTCFSGFILLISLTCKHKVQILTALLADLCSLCLIASNMMYFTSCIFYLHGSWIFSSSVLGRKSQSNSYFSLCCLVCGGYNKTWRHNSIILVLGTRRRWVVSLMPRPLYPRGNCPRYLLDRRLGEPQSRSGRYGEEKNLTPAGNRSPAVQPVALRYTDWGIPIPFIC
jgi:hypothetical protein